MSVSISIIIPTYNRVHLIGRAIKSILMQSFATWELIVVDDGSTDHTEEFITQYSSDKRIKYYKKHNSGAAESRNTGVEKATNNLITFLDSDDEADPLWLEKMTDTLLENQASVVCCGLERFNQSGKSLGIGMPESMEPLFKNFQGRFTNGGVFLMYRKIFLAIGGFDSELKSGQHTEMSYRLIPYLIEHQLRIANIMEPLIKVHVHEGPRIRYNSNAIFEGSTRTLSKHEQLFKNDRQRYINYLSVAGVSGVRTKRYDEAKRYFWKALKQDPYRLRYWFRWFISYIPGLRDQIWKSEIKNS